MANWCQNRATFRHYSTTAVSKLYDALKAGNTCQTFLPVGEIPDPAGSPVIGWAQVDTQSKTWGTKWDFTVDLLDQSGKEITARFETAWSPPVGLYAELVRLGYEVDAMYFEPGMDFGGTWQDGEEDSFTKVEQLYYTEDLSEEFVDVFALDDYFDELRQNRLEDEPELNDEKGETSVELQNIPAIKLAVKVFPSFSGLLRFVSSGYDFTQDDNNSLYFFGTSREGMEETFSKSYVTKTQKDGLHAMLDKAFSEGRVSFARTVENNRAKDEEARLVWLCAALAERGHDCDVGVALAALDQSLNTVNNIPALERWVFENFVGVEVVSHLSTMGAKVLNASSNAVLDTFGL